MENILEKYIKYAPLAFFCLFLCKMLVFPATWEGAVVTLVAGLLAGIYEYKNIDKNMKELEQKLEIITTTVNAQAKAIENVSGGVSALRLASQARPHQATSSQQRTF